MDYAKFAIASWIILTIIIAIASKKAIFRQFGIPQNRPRRMDWKGYLFIAMILGACIAVGLTFLVKSLS